MVRRRKEFVGCHVPVIESDRICANFGWFIIGSFPAYLQVMLIASIVADSLLSLFTNIHVPCWYLSQFYTVYDIPHVSRMNLKSTAGETRRTHRQVSGLVVRRTWIMSTGGKNFPNFLTSFQSIKKSPQFFTVFVWDLPRSLCHCACSDRT